MQLFLIYLFLQNALHVSDGSSAHHQEQKTVHAASGIVNQYCCLLHVQFCAPDDGRRNRLKHVEYFVEINKLRKDASCWLYFGNIFAMYGHTNVKRVFFFLILILALFILLGA